MRIQGARRFAFGYPPGLIAALTLAWILRRGAAGQLVWSPAAIVVTGALLGYFVVWITLGPAASLAAPTRDEF